MCCGVVLTTGFETSSRGRVGVGGLLVGVCNVLHVVLPLRGADGLHKV